MPHSSLCTALQRGSVLFALLLAMAPVGPALGQDAPPSDETLVGGVTSSGGYGAPTAAVTAIDGEARAIMGGQGGWVINRQFVIGGAGRGLVTTPDLNFNSRSAELQMGYGGLLLEYIGAPSELVHYGTSVVLGGGTAQIVPQGFDPRDDESFDQTTFFAAEGGARLELNVTTYFRIGVTGGYRLVAGSDLQDVSDADLGGPYGELSLRFGSF